MADLKSPLNAAQQIYSAGNRTLDLSANENNVPLNLPAQVEPEQPTIVKSNQPVTQPQRNTERKASLATVAKNLDSILEESEHDSSTCLAKSSTISSPTSSFDDENEDLDDEDDDDFDSDCSVTSEQLEHDADIDYEANLIQFQKDTGIF